MIAIHVSREVFLIRAGYTVTVAWLSLSVVCYSDEIQPTEINSSLALAVGAASEWSEDGLHRTLGDYEDVNEFENRRMKDEAIKTATLEGAEFLKSGFPTVSFTVENVALSDYDFDRKTYRVCLPKSTALKITNDVPLRDGPMLKLSYGEDLGKPEFQMDVPGCKRKPFLGFDFYSGVYTIPIPDDGVAERLYNASSQSGGLSVSGKCALNNLSGEASFPFLTCSVVDIAFSVNSTKSKQKVVFLRKFWDDAAGAYKEKWMLDID